MEKKVLQKLLIDVAKGRIAPEEATERLKTLPYDDMGFAKLDTHRPLRTGRAEVVFGIGKTPEQVAAIMKRLSAGAPLVIATKAGPEYYEAAKGEIPEGLVYYEQAQLLVYRADDNGLLRCARNGGDGVRNDGEGVRKDGEGVHNDGMGACSNRVAGGNAPDADMGTGTAPEAIEGRVAVVCAGTADIGIAEEAAIASELYGVPADRYYDIGVAGIHRLFDKVDDIRKASVIVVVAGMEGALASVVGGLVDVPVIAVPTSVGYGASMGGLTALLAMLNTCSLGVSVVNIDNGFGAGYQASLIVKGKK